MSIKFHVVIILAGISKKFTLCLRAFGVAQLENLVNSDELVPVGHFLDDEDFLGLVVLVQVDDGAASAQRLQLRELVEAVEGQAAHFVVRHRHL